MGNNDDGTRYHLPRRVYLVPQPQQCFSQQQSSQRRGMLVLLPRGAIVLVTLAVVYVMVVKPTLW